jgi:uncharacterized protein HemX
MIPEVNATKDLGLLEHSGTLIQGGLALALAVGGAFFSLWNKNQSQAIKNEREQRTTEMNTLKDSVTTLRTTLAENMAAMLHAHEEQEKRFDAREHTIKHELGAQNAITLKRVDMLEVEHKEALKSIDATLKMVQQCQLNHANTAIRRDDFQRLDERISGLTKEFVALKDSVLRHHAKEHSGED